MARVDDALSDTLTPDQLARSVRELRGVIINDRYEIKGVLGRGGMGTVYLARDRRLDREVALKLHHAGSADDRLQREALAMAKLAHPNVVTVFEIATFEDALFVAMEYVRGTTLRGWFATPRTWREIVDVLLAAGNGLVAAHAAGLVHRDFKPENVLVGEDGRARVSDFGLANASAHGESTSDGDGTQSAVAGTPAYMAPEQFAPEPVDARADQFAFCVVAWELLYGKRPFAGATPFSLLEAVKRHELPEGGKMLPRIRAVLERGLQVEPEDRYPDMTALLAALRAAAYPSRAKYVALAIAVGAIAVAAAFLVGSSARAPVCIDGAVKLANTWNDAQRSAVAGALTEHGFAASVPTVQRALDAYAGAWVTMYGEACEATNVRGEQSADLLDRRMACLDRRRQDLGAVVELLAHADRDVAAKANESVHALGVLDACADRNALLAVTAEPSNLVRRQQLAVLRARLATAEALGVAGKLADAHAQARAVAEAARALDHKPFTTEAVFLLGRITEDRGDNKAAEKIYYEALHIAEASGDVGNTAELWIAIVNTAGYLSDRTDEAERLYGLADAAVERAGRPPRLEMMLARDMGNLRLRQGKYTEARDAYVRAAEIGAKLLGADAPYVAHLRSMEANQLEQLGKLDEAYAAYAKTAQITERSVGPDHPDMIVAYENLGTISGRLGNTERALSELGKARELALKTYGRKHRTTAELFDETGLVFFALHRDKEALPWIQQAAEMAEAAVGPENSSTLDYLGQIAVLYKRLGRLDEAWTIQVRVTDLTEKVRGPEHPRLATKLQNLANLADARGDAKAALPLYERALAIFVKTYGEDHVNTAIALGGAGAAQMKLGNAKAAVPLFERALAIAQKVLPKEIPARQYALAGALWTSGIDRRRALELAAQVRVALEKAGLTKDVREVDAWLRGKHV